MTSYPDGKFPVILADPPRHFKTYSHKGQGRSALRDDEARSDQEPTRRAMAERDSVLLLWAKASRIRLGFEGLNPGEADGLVFETPGIDDLESLPQQRVHRWNEFVDRMVSREGCGFGFTRHETAIFHCRSDHLSVRHILVGTD